jgi:hypothetical protein
MISLFEVTILYTLSVATTRVVTSTRNVYTKYTAQYCFVVTSHTEPNS